MTPIAIGAGRPSLTMAGDAEEEGNEYNPYPTVLQYLRSGSISDSPVDSPLCWLQFFYKDTTSCVRSSKLFKEHQNQIHYAEGLSSFGKSAFKTLLKEAVLEVLSERDLAITNESTLIYIQKTTAC